MAEVRQIPLDEYESMKKSYGFSDDQMKSIIGVEPFAKRWADGYGESRNKEVDEVKLKHQKLVEEINKKLKNQNSSSENSVKTESPVNKVVEEIKTQESKTSAETYTPKEEPVKVEEQTVETVVADTPSFEIPTEETVTAEEPSLSFYIPTFEPVQEQEEAQSFDVPSFEPVEMEAPSFEPATQDVPSFEMPVTEPAKEENVQSFDTPTFETLPEEDQPFDAPAFEPVPEFTASKENNVVERTEEVVDIKSEVKAEKIEETSATVFSSPIFNNPIEREEEELVIAPTKVEMQDENSIEREKAAENLRNKMFEMGQKKLLELIKSDYEQLNGPDFSR